MNKIDVNKIKLRPEYILIKPVSDDVTTASGIIIPKVAGKDGSYEKGIIVKVGESSDSGLYKVDDEVMYVKSAVNKLLLHTVEQDNEEFVFARTVDVPVVL